MKISTTEIHDVAVVLVRNNATSAANVTGASYGLVGYWNERDFGIVYLRLKERVAQLKKLAKMNRKTPLADAKRTTPLADSFKPPFAE